MNLSICKQCRHWQLDFGYRPKYCGECASPSLTTRSITPLIVFTLVSFIFAVLAVIIFLTA